MSNFDLFQQTQRPSVGLFYRRDDPNDVRLGETVQHAVEAYTAASVVILGCPQDEGVQRNGGRVGARLAPDAIRRCLYRLTINGLAGLTIFDLGDTRIQPTLEATHALHQAVVQRVLSDGKRLIVLGGGNDTSYPDCAALAQVSGDVLAFNIDAHFDVRADAIRNSGTPYRQLLSEGWLRPQNFFELGYQPFANSPVYLQYLQALGVQAYPLLDWRAQGLEATVQRLVRASSARAIFWGFDLDAVCAADAPGVSAPNPIGLSGTELCQLAALAGAEPRTRLIEFSEVNPNHDIDQRTCRLTAVAIHYFLTAVAASAK